MFSSIISSESIGVVLVILFNLPIFVLSIYAIVSFAFFKAFYYMQFYLFAFLLGLSCVISYRYLWSFYPYAYFYFYYTLFWHIQLLLAYSSFYLGKPKLFKRGIIITTSPFIYAILLQSLIYLSVIFTQLPISYNHFAVVFFFCPMFLSHFLLMMYTLLPGLDVIIPTLFFILTFAMCKLTINYIKSRHKEYH